METKIFNFKARWLLVPLVLLTLGAGNAWGDSYSWTLASGDLGTTGSPSSSVSKGSPSKTWSASYTWGGSGATKYFGYASGKGVQIGSGSSTNKCSKLVLSTSGISGTITNITVYGCHANSGGAKITIKVGSTTVKSQTSFTTSDAPYSTGTISASGTIEITIDNSASKAFYINSIAVTYTAAASCTQNPTVSAGSNSSVTATTATVSCSGISSLGSAGCSISSYGFVIGGSDNPSIGGGGVTQHEVGTSYTTLNTSFSKNLTGLSPTTTYYVRPYATNGKGTAYGTRTSFTTESKGCTDKGASSITGGALSDADHGPLHAYYGYSTSQILYTKSDLDLAAGKKGTIKSIYFEYSGAAAMAARTIKIYMANTDLSSLTTSNYVPYASFTQVYSGTFSCGSAGWYEITLDTPFDYDGIGNLVVMVDDNTKTYESTKSFKYHSATGKQIYKRQDGTDIDPASWTPASAIDYRPNTKFCIQEADMTPATVTLMDDGATITEPSAGEGVTLPSRTGCTGYTFAGWTKSWVTAQTTWTTTAPDIIEAGNYTPSSNENLYPVYTKTEGSGGGATLTKMVTGNTLADGDKIVVVANGTTIAMYQETTSTSYVQTWDCSTLNTSTVSADDKNWWTVSATEGGFYLGDETNGYLNMSSNNLYCNNTQSKWTLNDLSDGTFKLQSGGRNLSYRSDLTTTKWRMGGSSYGTSGQTVLDIYKYSTSGGSTTYYISVPNCCTPLGSINGSNCRT